jgi:dolichol kinase
MYTNILNLIYLNILFIILLLVSEFVYKKIANQNDRVKEYLRKSVHIITSLLFIYATFTLNQTFFIILVAESLISVIASKYINVFHSLNKTRDKKSNLGGELYAIALIIVAIIFYNNLILIREALLVVGLSDSIAAVIGMNIPLISYKILKDNKSIIGSFTFFVITFLIFIFFKNGFMISIISSLSLAIIESISSYGSDNLTLILITPLLLTLNLYDNILVLIALAIIFLSLFPFKEYHIKNK